MKEQIRAKSKLVASILEGEPWNTSTQGWVKSMGISTLIVFNDDGKTSYSCSVPSNRCDNRILLTLYHNKVKKAEVK